MVYSIGYKRSLVITSLIIISPLTKAGSASGVAQMPEIVVESTSVNGGLPNNLPANSAGYSAKEIYQQVNVINTEDIVKYSPDTMTRKRYIGDRNSIIETRTASVTTSAHSLVYVDDILLSNLLGNKYAFPPRWSMVMPEEIKRVDFFFGPYSAEYPGNSVGTTVLISTRMPKKFEGHVKAQVFAEDFDEYSTHQTYHGSNLSALLGGTKGGLSMLLGVEHLDSNGHPMSFATLGKTATHSSVPVTGVVTDTDSKGATRLIAGSTSQDHTVQDTMKLKLAYDLSPAVTATYLFGVWQNDSFNHSESYLRDAGGNPITSGYVSYNGTTYFLNNAFGQNTWSQQQYLHALTFKSKTQSAWNWEAVLSAYDINQDRQHASLPDGKTVSTTTYYGQLSDNPYGDGWQTLDLKASWRSTGKIGALGHELSFGYHLDHYALDSHTYYTTTLNDGSWQHTDTQSQLSSASKGDTRTEALYIQDAWRFKPNWQLIAGGRYEQWKAYRGANSKLVSGALSSADYTDRNENAFSPKLALEYTPNDQWLLRAAVGKAYRMPTVTELFQALTVGTSVTTNNPDLKPEQAISTELTAERGLATGLMRVSLFDEEMENALYSQPTVVSGTTVTAVENIDKVRTYGATLAYQQSDVGVNGLDLNGSITYAHARTLKNTANPDYEGKVFPGVPDWRATLVATYHPDERIAYTLAARYSGKQYKQLDNSDINQDVYTANSAYFVVDTRVTYTFSKHFKGAVGIDNLNNNHYYAYHPMPQRTYHAELKYDF